MTKIDSAFSQPPACFLFLDQLSFFKDHQRPEDGTTLPMCIDATPTAEINSSRQLRKLRQWHVLTYGPVPLPGIARTSEE